MKKKIRLNYCKIFALCHGQSELFISEHLRSNLRLPLEGYARSNGRNNIQITSVLSVLNNSVFKEKEAFLKRYSNIQDPKGDTKKLKFYIIMDTDDCTQDERKNFLNKKMFKGHWLEPYIIPIVNDGNLEEVIKDAKIEYDEIHKKDKTKKYIKIFPKKTSKITKDADIKYIEEVKEKLKVSKKTNMDKFFEDCLKEYKNIKK